MDKPLKHAMVCWNPNSNQVLVVSHPDRTGASDSYEMTAGACCFDQWADPADRMKWLLQIFNAMVVRDGVDPQAAHKAFLAIPEYRRFIPADQEGAE